MSLVGYGYDSSSLNPSSGEKKKEQTPAVSRRSSLLEPKKKYESPCFCSAEVDLDVFRGVFTDQWLHGRAYGNNEEIFFCTSCGPTNVQCELQDARQARAGSDGGVSGGKASTASAEAKSTSAKIKKFFSFGLSSSGKRSAADGGPPSATGASKENGKPPRHAPSSAALRDEELPVTPRSDKELFLCVTCGACYCRDHARDHHYSRRHVETNVDAVAPSSGYPYHSYFVGVPSYISTHKEHRIKETEWGLLLPTVTIKEIQPYITTAPTSLTVVSKAPTSTEKKKSKSSSLLPRVGSSVSATTTATGTSAPITTSPVLSRPIPFYNAFEELCDGAATRCLSAVHSRGASGTGLASLSTSYSETPQFAAKRESSVGEPLTPSRPTTHGSGEALGTFDECPLSPPSFHASPPDNWSLLVWCASCGDRPIRFSGKYCDNEKGLHRHLRRLGQLLAVLAYMRRAGVQLRLPEAYLTYMDKKQADQHARQLKQRKALCSAEVQRVSKASEGYGGTGPTLGSPVVAETVDNYYGESLYDRSSTDRIMTEAALAGFANPSFYCYVNSVFQCVLRCGLFCRPLLRPLVAPGSTWTTSGPLTLTRHRTLDGRRAEASVTAADSVNAATVSPGKLTLSFTRLMDQLLHQTYQDVRNGAVYPFARTVFHQVCRVCPLFEEDTQQDAQEFLISLLNGVADEFDEGKSEEEKKKSKRISFEGVLRHEVVCSSCFHRVPRDEMFMALSIPAKASIEEGLKSVFETQKLKDSDKYACEYCFKKLSRTEQASHNDLAAMHEQERKELAKAGKKPPAGKDSDGRTTPLAKDCVYQEAEVHTIISRLGGTLAVHILRFQYDPVQQDFAKVTAPVKIPLTLDLTPYVDTEVIRTYSNVRSLFTLKQRFPDLSEEELEKKLAESKWDCAAATRAMQETLGESGDRASSSTTHPKAAEVATRPPSAASGKRGTTARPKMDVLALKREAFNPFGIQGSRCPSLQRQLVGIVAHRGSLHGGHYIAFVRLLSQPDVWFRCDDEDVDVVDEKTVLDCSSEVYLAFYE